MTGLTIHGSEISTIFGLLGETENNITYSTGWVLSKSDTLLKSIIKTIVDEDIDCHNCIIRLQEYKGKDGGYTDIEIFVEKEIFLIIEAKRGWNLPDKEQLLRYLGRFEEYKGINHKLVVISECKRKYAEKELKKYGLKIPVTFISWQTILTITKDIQMKVGYYEKNLLKEYSEYLQEVITIRRDIKSNMVYCVSLGLGTPEFSKISWIDIVEKKHKYFFPVGTGGWPSEPPNYMAFRYHGKLQSIHHVEDYEIEEHLHSAIPEITDEADDALMYLLDLGPAFKPEKEVKNGKIYARGRYWCMLDTLFICDTVQKARDLTKKRLGKE